MNKAVSYQLSAVSLCWFRLMSVLVWADERSTCAGFGDEKAVSYQLSAGVGLC
jgi:hypothetical protein